MNQETERNQVVGVTINGCQLLCNHWFQLLPGQEAKISLGRFPLIVILRLEENGLSRKVGSRVEPSSEADELTLIFYNISKAGLGGYGTQRPWAIAVSGDHEILVSYHLVPFFGTALVSVAFYSARVGDHSDDG